MPRLIATLPLLLSLVCCPGLAAQDSPAHLASCTTDSAARFFLMEVQYLLAGTDSASRARRAALQVDASEPPEALLITEDGICLEAAREAGLHPPYPLAVVRAGRRYLVRLPDRTHPLLAVFDLNLHRLATEGAGP